MTEYGYDAKDEALGKLYQCLAKNLRKWDDEEDSVRAEHRDLIRETRALLEQVKIDIPNILTPEPVWAGPPDPAVDPADPDAPATAVEVAAEHGAKPRRATDTASGNAPCWIAFEWPSSALIVYDDEPDAIVATDNHPGRFVEAKAQ